MKNILLLFQDDDAAPVALDTALLVADRFSSHIEGLFVRRTPTVIADGGLALPGVYLTQMEDDSRKLAAAARKRFAGPLAKRGITVSDSPDSTDIPTASWREVEGVDTHIIAEYARLYDLTVVGRGKKSAGGWMDVCESALFESGRPVLVAGAKVHERLGENVVIAWNCSTECARTVALSMPLLSQAREIHVVTTEAITVPGPSGEDMATQLRRSGIPASATSLKSDGGAEAGAAVLERTSELGADLLLKSAYTQTRLRQIIFGGATRQILSKAELPVLMAH